jgi:hypothetical protein
MKPLLITSALCAFALSALAGCTAQNCVTSYNCDNGVL